MTLSENLSEKITKLANKIPQVYDAGVKSFANQSQGYLNGDAEGEKFVEIYDVSASRHYVEVSVKSPALEDMLNENNKDFTDRKNYDNGSCYIEWVKENGVSTNRIHIHSDATSNNSTFHFDLFHLVLEPGTYYFKTDNTALYVSSRAYSVTSGSWKEHTGKEISITFTEKSNVKVRGKIARNKNQIDVYGTPQFFKTIYLAKSVPITVKDKDGRTTKYKTDENGIANNIYSIYPFMRISSPEGLISVKYVKDIVIVANQIATQVLYEGYKAGFQALDKGEYYNQFWDDFQQYGNRTIYARAFASIGWTNLNFKPKYNIICNGNCELMFGYTTNIKGNLKEILGQLGITLDTSKATNLASAFAGIYNITHLPKISLASAGTSINNILRDNPKLVEVEEIEFNGNVHNTMFVNCPKLTRLIATGVISTSGLDLKTSTGLDRESITSIINVLSSTVSGKSITLSETAVELAFRELRLEEDGKVEHYVPGVASEAWQTLIDTKPSWTINLV